MYIYIYIYIHVCVYIYIYWHTYCQPKWILPKGCEDLRGLRPGVLRGEGERG